MAVEDGLHPRASFNHGCTLMNTDKPKNVFSRLKCPHELFRADVAVNRLSDSGRFNADIRIRCEQCGEPFRFLGLPAGIDLNGAAVSADGTEARLAIGTAETVANIIDGDCPVGFTVRRGS